MLRLLPVARYPPAKAMMDRFAPKTAALETPRVEGDAMELFRVVCMIRPERPRPAPAMAAASTRGMRIFQMIRTLAAVPVLLSAAQQSAAVILDDPTNRQPTPSTSTAMTIAAMTMVFFLFLARRLLENSIA